jgi:hypothetical protein
MTEFIGHATKYKGIVGIMIGLLKKKYSAPSEET